MSIKRSTNSTRILKTSLARGADSVLKHFGLRVVKDAKDLSQKAKLIISIPISHQMLPIISKETIHD
jgi:aromatic ring-opening dioxygenase LigB subunit